MKYIAVLSLLLLTVACTNEPEPGRAAELGDDDAGATTYAATGVDSLRGAVQVIDPALRADAGAQ